MAADGNGSYHIEHHYLNEYYDDLLSHRMHINACVSYYTSQQQRLRPTASR